MIPAHTPTTGTGLTGEWLLGPFGALRADFNLTPRDIVVRDAVAAWETVRDLLTVPTPHPSPLDAPRRSRSVRRLHGLPVAIAGHAVLADADRVFYQGPGWLAQLVAGLREPHLGVVPTDDTGHHLDALVVREAGVIIAVVGLRRLNAPTD